MSSDLYLRIQAVSMTVGDLQRSLAFYRDVLGFRTSSQRSPFGGHPIGFVVPPHGDAILILSESDSSRQGAIPTIALLTNDLDAQYREWSARGVQFTEAPKGALPWARLATFVDVDGNVFNLIEADILTRQLEAARQAEAERAARERLAEREIAIATQVQAGFFPRDRPALQTLDYEGTCLPARQVGGDYFDFLEFGTGRLSLVIGDVSGKGLGAALLMANLQAHIRGQFARYGDDLPALLSSVNRLFVQSAPPASYATLFLGVYDDATRRLRFVNCGHPPPLVCRSDGRIESLTGTGLVLGMFDEWTGTEGEIELAANDVLALYTDGVTDAVDRSGEEFGLPRLKSALEIPAASAADRLQRLLTIVNGFGSAEQFDDITMVIARGR
jgi:serine phosphatase RsbU (regulator of sigma subunit)/predicted enzyme related to lactoylglutathione lyase